MRRSLILVVRHSIENMINLTSINLSILRSTSNRLVLLAVVCWLGAATTAYFGYQTSADWLIVAFAIFGFSGALAWVTYCVCIGLRWLHTRWY